MVTTCLVSALVSGTAIAALPQPQHRIAVIAHRGGAALAPENTLAAFRRAIALGADYVEVDVRCTRDGRLVLLHDGTVDRTTDGAGPVAELDYAALRRLDAGRAFSPDYAGGRVPSLDEALRLCRDRIGLYLDHKDGPTADVIRAVRRHRMEAQVVVYSGVEELQEWKRLAPQIAVMPSVPDEYRSPDRIAAFLDLLPAEVLDGGAGEWTAELVQAAHARGALVYVDNLGLADHEAAYRRSLEIGVDGIQTDHPDALLALLEKLAPPATP